MDDVLLPVLFYSHFQLAVDFSVCCILYFSRTVCVVPLGEIV